MGQNPTVTLGKAKALTPGLPQWKEQIADALMAGIDGVMGAVGLGSDSKASQVGELISAAVPILGATKALTIGKLASKVKQPIKAYHGSPHDFDQFSLSKIGTGEGAQAYGHGLYFSESPQVAEYYRDALAPKIPSARGVETPYVARTGGIGVGPGGGSLVVGTTKGGEAMRASGKFTKQEMDALAHVDGEDIDGAIQSLREQAAMQWRGPDARKLWAERADTLERLKPEISFKAGRGKAYEVSINADPEDFLDWDAPLSQQPKVLGKLSASDKSRRYMELQDAIDRMQKSGKLDTPEWNAAVDESLQLRELSGGIAPTMTGEEVHRSMWAAADAPVNRGRQSSIATERLKSHGIPGIKYLDGASRSAGQGSRNYVVFDDQLVSIVKKYGIVGALSAGLVNNEQAHQLIEQGFDYRKP